METQPYAPDRKGELAGILHRNIHALVKERRKQDARMSRQQRVVARITAFTGSMLFVYLQVLLFGGWLIVNLGWIPGVKPFDPFPCVMLAMWASVEAIFLATFVLISQNRMSELADRRADLDLQVSLLAEHEITKLIHLVDELSRNLGVKKGPDPHLEELKRDVAPERVLQEMDRAQQEEKK
jgi:uncharacterized membrane protein